MTMLIFDHEWQNRNYLVVAAYCVIAAHPETGEVWPLTPCTTVVGTVAHACDLGYRYTSNVMGHLRQVGLLRYDAGGKYPIASDQCRVFVNREWMPPHVA